MVQKLAAIALMLFLLSGCTTIQTVSQNIDSDIQAIMNRLHVDVTEVISHPERWGKVVDSLCEDGMLLARDCVQLKALIKARDIAVGIR